MHFATFEHMPARDHGHSCGYPGRQTKTYGCWLGIRQRCLNPSSDAYRHYGGRGIKLCERWNDFRNFLADMGEKPQGLWIERINNDGDYEPSNCRWATPDEQHQNMRGVRRFTFNGQTHTITEWAKIIGIERGTLRCRLDRDWTLERALQPAYWTSKNRKSRPEA